MIIRLLLIMYANWGKERQRIKLLEEMNQMLEKFADYDIFVLGDFNVSVSEKLQ